MIDKKVLILIGGHLATAPRVQKEAAALKKAGATVIVRGTWRDSALAAEDVALANSIGVDFSAVVDIRQGKNFSVRLRQKIASLLFSKLGWVTPRVFGLGAPELLKEAKRIKADVTMVHSEAGLWVASKLLGKGYRIGVDFEDWFSQDLPERDRKFRPVHKIQQLERHLLRKADCCLATTLAMSEALAKDAGVTRLPTVIPNCFPFSEREHAVLGERDSKLKGVVSFYWFSQTIGPDRGLETLAQALLLLEGHWQLIIRGNLRGYGDWYARTFSSAIRTRVHLATVVTNNELLARTMSHDVGLALEIPYCISRDVTATNKIFEYLRGGLAVIATNTKGQVEVMSRCGEAGITISENSPAELAKAMQVYISQSELLELSKREAVTVARQIWSWENHEKSLVGAIYAALNAN